MSVAQNGTRNFVFTWFQVHLHRFAFAVLKVAARVLGISILYSLRVTLTGLSSGAAGAAARKPGARRNTIARTAIPARAKICFSRLQVLPMQVIKVSRVHDINFSFNENGDRKRD
jgi:hypothetical protein